MSTTLKKVTAFETLYQITWGFPGGSVVTICLPMQETQETWVGFLGWEDPLEKEMATHSNILAWRIPCTEEPGGQQSMGSQELYMTEQLSTQACQITCWKSESVCPWLDCMCVCCHV